MGKTGLFAQRITIILKNGVQDKSFCTPYASCKRVPESAVNALNDGLDILYYGFKNFIEANGIAKQPNDEEY